MTTIEEVIGQRVRIARAALDLNQKDLAARVGATLGKTWYPQYVTELEAGRRVVKAAELAALAHVLGVAPGALLTPANDVSVVNVAGGTVPAEALRSSADDAHARGLERQRQLTEELRDLLNTARQGRAFVAQSLSALDATNVAVAAIADSAQAILANHTTDELTRAIFGDPANDQPVENEARRDG